MKIRKFQLSCKYFSGFTHSIDIDNHSSMETVITEIKDTLICILKDHYLEVLIDRLKDINYHYHNYIFDDVIKYDKTYFLCNHCEIFSLNI